ncbi:Smr/MutS family protein [Swingsia samuiensis]|uniref:DNA mismatch repair protein MutS n=1 Tax=Swingsia samuiensis TaxID=1293412 RepID=A0A4Y6UKE9_9PROT|nr:Smr/MutS family protein [Swingsia samuiensis]QDH18063.1 DNA mismatch repair protein MutS [Swingsia samuiensis]
MVVRDIKPLSSPRRSSPSMVKTPEKEDVVSIAKLKSQGASKRDTSFEVVFRQPEKKVTKLQELRVGVRAPGLDDTSWRRLSRGKVRVDAKLDLHGYVVQEAFENLLEFLHRARVRNWKCIEVVTGRGSGPSSGLIRRELPMWLQRQEIRPMILAVVHPHAANHGSVRILLRTKKH